MSDTIGITLTIEAKNATKEIIATRTFRADVTQTVTHHGRFTVNASAVDEEHKFPDFNAAVDAKKTLAVLVAAEDLQVAVGAAASEKRTLKKGVPAVITDTADLGKFFFTNAASAEVSVEYFVGQIA